ncbi:Oxidoreductase [Lachnellula willkommii]|uniref:Oxidoreductase n=1 Tax=Lachnellula willkommii TaxID=215461 RepID=A0A559MBC7_9HELO|nr:Oxidoreductase [Lachnellula willkommii]
MTKGLHLIFGGTRLGNPGWNGVSPEDASDEAAHQIFDILKKNNVNLIDTARRYGNSEAALGRLKAGTEHGFLIDTKWVGGTLDPTSTTKDRIISDAKDSLAKLGIPKVHTFSLHSPDVKPEIEETLIGIDEVYKLGGFEHFGLSNFSAAQVQQVYDICKAKGLVLPTVYQGLYSPVNRNSEDELLPLLRKLGIVFNAYSALAGGFLTNTKSHILNGEGRFAKENFGGLYDEMYNNEPYLQAHEEWGKIADDEGVTRAALAYRWVNYHSALKAESGDGIVLGGRLSHMNQAFEAIDQGPLSKKTAESIENLWEKLKPRVKYADNLAANLAVRSRS